MKNLIGSAKTIIKESDGQKFSSLKITLKMDEAEKFVYEKEGRRYLTFDVNKMREVNQYGKTHYCSIWSKDEDIKEEIHVTPEISEDELPF